MRALILLTGILTASAVHAQEELRFGSGITHETNSESTYGWELDYAHGLSEHSYLTLGLANEGHQLNSHRDGFTAQLWARADVSDRLSLAAGLGPYLYFDTARDEAHPAFARYGNGHGVRPIYSAEITWYLDGAWLAYLRANHIETEPDATMLLLGLGYRFDGQSGPGLSSASPVDVPGPDELALYLGRTTLNSFAPERSTAFALEYRRRLDPHLDWTLGWLNEGGNEIIRRNGIVSQLWLVQPLLDGRFSLGAGAGLYVVVNQQDQTFVLNHQGKPVRVGSDDERVAAIVSLTASYRFDPRWSARVSFNRLTTHYDRDADVILLGGGYSF